MEDIKRFKQISRRRITQKPHFVRKSSSNSSNYWPYDRQKLLQRIQTFPSSFINNEQLNPLTCALKGWIWQKSGLLRCVGCAAVLSLKIVETLEGEYNEELVMRYCDLVEREGHYRNCAWRVKGVPIEVYDLKELDEASVVEFGERYLVNYEYVDRIDNIEVFPELTSEDIEDLEKVILEKEGTFNLILATITLLGWKISSQIGDLLILYSESDGRKLPVNIKEKETLDLIEEHHSWDCFQSGYGNLLKAIKFHNEGTIGKFEYEAPSTTTVETDLDKEDGNNNDENDYDDAYDTTIDDKLQDSLARLENLKKVYF